MCTFTAEFLDGKTTIDSLENGVSVWSQASLAKGLKFELKDNYFNLNGQPTFFIGANTTGMMWYSANENPLVWKKDFAAMQDYGLMLDLYVKEPQLLPDEVRLNFEKFGKMTAIVDYVAGLTDLSAVRMFEQYFVPKVSE